MTLCASWLSTHSAPAEGWEGTQRSFENQLFNQNVRSQKLQQYNVRIVELGFFFFFFFLKYFIMFMNFNFQPDDLQERLQWSVKL